MHDAERLSLHGRELLNRRNFLRNTGLSLGGMALAHILAGDGLLGADKSAVEHKMPIRPIIDPKQPYAPRAPHFATKAKQILMIYCPGAVSHVDTFDYNPSLIKLHGQ